MLIRRLQNLYTTGQAHLSLRSVALYPFERAKASPSPQEGSHACCVTLAHATSAKPQFASLRKIPTYWDRKWQHYAGRTTRGLSCAQQNNGQHAQMHGQGGRGARMCTYFKSSHMMSYEQSKATSLRLNQACYMMLYAFRLFFWALHAVKCSHPRWIPSVHPQTNSPGLRISGLCEAIPGKEVSQYILLLKLCMESNSCQMFIKFYHC